jgi:sensor histidine kinase YesM
MSDTADLLSTDAKRRDLASGIIFNFFLCTFIGFVTTTIWGGLWNNMVISHCIGWCAYGSIELLIRWRWANQDIPKWGYLLFIPIGLFFGVLGGGSLAMVMLGYAIPWNRLASALTHWQTLVITGTATMVAVGFGIWRSKVLERDLATAKLAAQAQTSQRELADAQLNLVRTQVEPHMLFNTLANLRILISTDRVAAVKMLDHFNDYLRASLNTSRVNSNSLGVEFKMLGDYLEIMKVRMGERLQYQLDLPDALKNFHIPTWLLQPLVENAIKHGLEPSIEGGQIHVSATKQNEFVIITVHNTGQPLKPDFNLDKLAPRTDGGFGLYQCKERLTRIYGNTHSFSVASTDQHSSPSTTVTIKITAQL